MEEVEDKSMKIVAHKHLLLLIAGNFHPTTVHASRKIENTLSSGLTVTFQSLITIPFSAMLFTRTPLSASLSAFGVGTVHCINFCGLEKPTAHCADCRQTFALEIGGQHPIKTEQEIILTVNV